MSGPHTAASEQPAGKLPAVLQALRALAETDLAPQAFYDQWLATLADVGGALAGRAWLAGGSANWHSVATAGQASGLPELPTERLEQLRRDRLPILAHAAASDNDAPLGITEVFVPWLTAGELRGAVAVVFAVEHPQAQQGCLKFVVEACEAVERFHLLHDRRDALRRAELKERELQLDEKLHRRLDFKTTTATIANDGRQFLGVDRVSVVLIYGERNTRVVAVSGQTDLVHRAGAMRALANLAQTWYRRFPGTTVFPRLQDGSQFMRDVTNFAYPPPKNNPELVRDLKWWDELEYPPEFVTTIERYVDEHFVKRLVIVPLEEVAYPDDETFVMRGDSKPDIRHGALILETFGEAKPIADEAQKVAALVRGATAAIRNARRYERLWLHPLWRVMGEIQYFLFGSGRAFRTTLILGILGAGIAAAFLTDTDYTAYCRGRLEPVERRRVFAAVDGVVHKIHVKHGDRVKPGTPLVELQNTELDIATADLQGRRTAAIEQSLSVKRSLLDSNQLSPAEKARLDGEDRRLTEEVASLGRQVDLLNAKRGDLILLSPIEGEITTWNADDLLAGRPIRQGQQLLTIARVAGPWELELNVPDDRSGRVVEAEKALKQANEAKAAAGSTEKPESLRVTYSPAVDPSLVREAQVTEIQNSADVHGPNSLGGGGNIVLVRASINPADLPQRRPGAEAAAHIHCGRRSVAYVWSRDLVDFVRSRILFRWF